MRTNNKNLAIGQKIRLTGIGDISELEHIGTEEIEQMIFPIETEVFYETGNKNPLCLGSERWAVEWFTYKKLKPE